jgi:hypothetical protein
MTKSIVDIEGMAKAVQLACRAPSLHNSQPWPMDRQQHRGRSVRRS